MTRGAGESNAVSLSDLDGEKTPHPRQGGAGDAGRGLLAELGFDLLGDVFRFPFYPCG